MRRMFSRRQAPGDWQQVAGYPPRQATIIPDGHLAIELRHPGLMEGIYLRDSILEDSRVVEMDQNVHEQEECLLYSFRSSCQAASVSASPDLHLHSMLPPR